MSADGRNGAELLEFAKTKLLAVVHALGGSCDDEKAEDVSSGLLWITSYIKKADHAEVSARSQAILGTALCMYRVSPGIRDHFSSLVNEMCTLVTGNDKLVESLPFDVVPVVDALKEKVTIEQLLYICKRMLIAENVTDDKPLEGRLNELIGDILRCDSVCMFVARPFCRRVLVNTILGFLFFVKPLLVDLLPFIVPALARLDDDMQSVIKQAVDDLDFDDSDTNPYPEIYFEEKVAESLTEITGLFIASEESSCSAGSGEQ